MAAQLGACDGRLLPTGPGTDDEQVEVVHHRDTASLVERTSRPWCSRRGPYAPSGRSIRPPTARRRRWGRGLPLRGIRSTVMAAETRWVRLDGAVNVRDLGGLPTIDGGTTARGRVYRADNLQELSAADRSEERRVGKECRSRWSP